MLFYDEFSSMPHAIKMQKKIFKYRLQGMGEKHLGLKKANISFIALCL